ncbi:MAG: DUF2842 domain-containing protein [Pseudomonadota bacterium]
MKSRQKKLIAVLAIMPALTLYMGLVLFVADWIPDHWALDLLFYMVAGTIWAFPLKPVFAWINHEPEGD